MTRRALLYYRQSLDAAEGIERQRARCRALVEARGWTVHREFVDNDTSASKPRGAGTAWAALMTELDAGTDDTVVVAVDIDRLLRTIQDLATIIETGAMVATVDGEIDLTTADGEFRATMTAALARFEVRRKGERQRRAQDSAARKGLRTSGRRPFGYDADGVTVRPEEAAAVREGYDLLLSGVPLGGIARRWNAAGFRTGQAPRTARGAGPDAPGGLWRHDNVRAVLMNARYAGLRAHKRALVIGEDGQVVRAEWPALVPEETWRAASEVLTNPTRRTGPRGSKRLLTGLARCGVCGATVHAGGAVAKYGMYRCSGSSGHVGRQSDPVDAYVGELVVARLSQPDAAELLVDHTKPDASALRAEARALRARLESVAIDFADGAVTSAQLRTITARLTDRLAAIDADMADAGRVDKLGPLVGAEDVAAAWEAMETDRRRVVIDALMTVTLHPPGRGTRTFRPESVGIDWRGAEASDG
ncbi:recombinase family protein [Occultella gossypii]|uniref:Recombinase family protein n=1 Tax=Occultella gossypii TaxID=2800820 RepID=A0ABS7S6P1_9MICO|nr:recombinase family protein [Occultella gossypii]MBZ2195967.1 recombinase family protein [Occultella gossypii]